MVVCLDTTSSFFLMVVVSVGKNPTAQRTLGLVNTHSSGLVTVIMSPM